MEKKLYLCEIELSKIELFICIKMDLVLNNLQWLICHKTNPNKDETISDYNTPGQSGP